MTITVFLALALGAGFVLRRWRGPGWALCTAVGILFLAVSCGPVPQWLLGALQSSYLVSPTIQWGNRNAIILLGAGTERSRPTGTTEPGTFAHARVVTAASLYLGCRQTGADCMIIASGGDAGKNGVPESSLYRSQLTLLGVRPADILSEPESRNTWQNAQFTSARLAQYGADRIVLVSSGFHLKRSALYFAHFGVHALPVRADYLGAAPSLLPLSYNLTVTDLALHEYIGIARFHLYNALRMNPPMPAPRGAAA